MTPFDYIDNHIKGSNETYIIFDTPRPFVSSILQRFRFSYPCNILWHSYDQVVDEIRNMNITKPFHWQRFVSNPFEGYELNSATDIRYSPLFMKIDGRSIEERYQLDIKGYKYAGITNWKDAKGKTPLKILPITTNYTRTGVGGDFGFLYTFTDNLMRTSGHNPIELHSIYARAFHAGNAKYPAMTQAVIRGLPNACPITTMKDCYGHQLDRDPSKTWEFEIRYIQGLLATGKFDGLKFFQKTFGQGTYSRLIPEYQEKLNEQLSKVGINNYGAIPVSEQSSLSNYQQLKQLYIRYFHNNPQLLYELAVIGRDRVFTERYASTNMTQVRFYADILNEICGLKGEAFQEG